MSNVREIRFGWSGYTAAPARNTDGEPQEFPLNLRGMCAALKAAVKGSAGGGTWAVTVTRAGRAKTFREYRAGCETWRSGCDLLPAAHRARSSGRPE